MRITNLSFNTSDVVEELIRNMQDMFGQDIPIKTIDERDLDRMHSNKTEMFAQDLTADQIARIKKANGFIHNGVIYINTSNPNPQTAIHELSHVILANLKFNPNFKGQYYTLVDRI